MTSRPENLIVNPVGTLTFRGRTVRCALGKGGCHISKKEGDGVTPIGTWPLRQVYYRPDRLDAPKSVLPVRALSQEDGWCDDPGHPDYNRLTRLPHPASNENLWRDDHVYDIIVTLGHNDDPVIAGAGSAIFFHLARANFEPTEGCVAVPLPEMLDILASIEPGAQMEIVSEAE